MAESYNGFIVKRLAIPVCGPLKLRLAAGHLTAPLSTMLSGISSSRPDVIYAYSPPLPFGVSGWFLKLIKNCAFVLGVQDLHPQCYIDQGVLKNRLLISILEGIESFCYRQASLITVHSEGNKEHIVKKKGVAGDKVIVLPNWIDTDEIKPLPRKNAFSSEHKLNDKFIVGYAGTLGMSQGPMDIVESAALIKDRENIEFFIVGDGLERDAMVKRVQELSLNNVRFLPMQPKAVYPWVVASCDVGLVTLNAKVKTPVVPSKILSMMAAGRPVLASMPLNGDAPKLIEESGCGLCVEPENPRAMADALVYLSNHPEMCDQFSQRGRGYIVRTMSLDKVMTDLEELFDNLVNK
jgi:glycosyltransferase involved in cell wall biosynthesis